MARVRKTIDKAAWELTQDMRQWAAEKVPGVNIDAEAEKFIDYWLANGKPMADWNAAFRNWMRRSPQFNRQTDTEDPYFAGRKYLC